MVRLYSSFDIFPLSELKQGKKSKLHIFDQRHNRLKNKYITLWMFIRFKKCF